MMMMMSEWVMSIISLYLDHVFVFRRMLSDSHLDMTAVSIVLDFIAPSASDGHGGDFLLRRLFVKGVLGDVPVFWFEVLPYKSSGEH